MNIYVVDNHLRALHNLPALHLLGDRYRRLSMPSQCQRRMKIVACCRCLLHNLMIMKQCDLSSTNKRGKLIRCYLNKILGPYSRNLVEQLNAQEICNFQLKASSNWESNLLCSTANLGSITKLLLHFLQNI